MEKRVLGRGLEALIPKNLQTIVPQEFVYLQLDKIQPANKQPRQEIDKDELKELTQSIKEKGIIQPIVVRKANEGKYEIVAGERRFRAAKTLNLNKIPAVVKDIDDKEAFVLAIIENLQRTDLNPLEEAQAFRKLAEEFAFSLEAIARFTGKNKTTVSNALRLLKLPDNIQQALKVGQITRTQARAILSAGKIQEQQKLFHQLLKDGLSVREIEKKARLVSPKKRKADSFVAEVEEELQQVLGTKVKIFNCRNNRGRIVVEYYTVEDLERIIKKIKG